MLESNAPQSYPHNLLRNLAMAYDVGAVAAENDFVLADDVDFIPTWDAHQNLIHLLKGSSNTRGISSNPPSSQSSPFLVDMLRNKTALVLPAFNLMEEQSADSLVPKANIIPKTRSQVVQLFDRNVIEVKQCHRSTNYTHWLKLDFDTSFTATVSYPIEPTRTYEPYFIAHRPSLPSYYNNFRGGVFDKQSFVAQVILEGFQFHVLQEFFLIHLPHSRSTIGTQRQLNIAEWEQNFEPYLREKYPNASEFQEQFFKSPQRGNRNKTRTRKVKH